MNLVPITQEGLDILKKELDKLLKEERPRVIRSIEEARSHGDLSENAEYHAAKERQGFIEGRIMELQSQVGSCQVEAIKGPYDRCVFGATVTLENSDTGEENTYTLVGPYESAPEKNRISIATPIGQALLGREEGDEVRVKTPKGVREYIIVAIK
ncbi:MAG: transcription elongation factor GreA [Candidatus Adiutrix intracellularis]|jgi:transcription elongation factor GreA|nr:transcription elongation factor GreA [Candidatus Adiutrix intracellularis]